MEKFSGFRSGTKQGYTIIGYPKMTVIIFTNTSKFFLSANSRVEDVSPVQYIAHKKQGCDP